MADRLLLNALLEKIQKNAAGRQTVFYGFRKEVYDALEEAGVHIEKIFTANPKIWEELPSLAVPYQEMEGKTDRYFAVIPFFAEDNGRNQRAVIEGMGYRKSVDYACYPFEEAVIKSPVKDYRDAYGNKVTIGCPNVIVRLNGVNNTVVMGGETSVGGNLNIILRGADNKVMIGEHCKFIHNKITCFRNCRVEIGAYTTFGSATEFYAHSRTKITVGRDCMFSFDAVVQAGDGHSIFDITTKKNINCNMDKPDEEGYLSRIILGEHVWVGRDALILSGAGSTEIQKGSVIGAKSFVKGCFPNNCSVAGVPAKVIRKNIAWSRKYCSDNIKDCGMYVDPTIQDSVME